MNVLYVYRLASFPGPAQLPVACSMESDWEAGQGLGMRLYIGNTYNYEEYKFRKMVYPIKAQAK